MKNIILFRTLACLYFFIALSISIFSYTSIKKGLTTNEWEKINGEVISKRIKESRKGKDSIYLDYSYKVEGNVYFSENIGCCMFA